jgi:Immunoglobulin I-set domain
MPRIRLNTDYVFAASTYRRCSSACVLYKCAYTCIRDKQTCKNSDDIYVVLCAVVAYQPPEAPVFVTRLESLDVFESSPVKLECEVRGFPQPEITWYQVIFILAAMHLYCRLSFCWCLKAEHYVEKSAGYGPAS